VMFLDLDDFKAVNDTLGHDAGDEVLKQVAARIQGCLRESDSTSRFGGDEFLLLLPMTVGKKPAVEVATKVLETLGKEFTVNGNKVNLGCSIGISIFPDDASQPEELINQADKAMYEAKQSGKGSYGFFQ